MSYLKNKLDILNLSFKIEKLVDCLNDLCEKFVLDPIDNTSNNVAIICKNYMSKKHFFKFAYMVITSTHITFQTNALVMNNPQFCDWLETWKEHKPLPFMYCMFKLCYTPSQARNIIGFSQYSNITIVNLYKYYSKRILSKAVAFARARFTKITIGSE